MGGPPLDVGRPPLDLAGPPLYRFKGGTSSRSKCAGDILRVRTSLERGSSNGDILRVRTSLERGSSNGDGARRPYVSLGWLRPEATVS